jgi:hypothetical protein
MNLLKTLFLGALVWDVGVTSADDVIIFVSPNGNDTSKGRIEADAVASIERAVELAEAVPVGTKQANVIVAPGRYKGQRFMTRGSINNVPILITSGSGERAIFDGDEKGGTWMTLKPRGGNSSNIKIRRITVTNYETAIDVQGNRNNLNIWAGGLEIRDSKFSDIGDIARTDAPPSTAAIRLVNSDRNVIVGNQFVRIQNKKLCGLLHALYIAHGSTENLIEDNTFEDSCGDAVRFRDGSGDNIVRSNLFFDSWSRSPVSDWFCNPADRKERGGKECTKEAGECPSYNNLIENNKVTARHYPPAVIFMSYGGKPPFKCEPTGRAQRAIVR